MGSPKSQLAKSVGKVSAKNLQILSIIIMPSFNRWQSFQISQLIAI
jgi:hypothetical protein